MIQASRYHDISTGHTVSGHESKCKHLHGHNYRIHFHCVADELDSVGRVVDFSVLKEKLCMWLEDNWDHKFLVWMNDPRADDLTMVDPEGVVLTGFNPTAENMAEHLVKVVGPVQLFGTGVTLRKVVIEETAKCSASFEL
jgi:6-pyruvoyltetrahydropterin/6-carboxytetrahydropterin synthase